MACLFVTGILWVFSLFWLLLRFYLVLRGFFLKNFIFLLRMVDFLINLKIKYFLNQRDYVDSIDSTFCLCRKLFLNLIKKYQELLQCINFFVWCAKNNIVSFHLCKSPLLYVIWTVAESTIFCKKYKKLIEFYFHYFLFLYSNQIFTYY